MNACSMNTPAVKQLKFVPELIPLIIAGKKTITWRPFDDKDLQVGDTLRFVTSTTGTVFGTAVITACVEKTFATLTDADWEGHERYESDEVMYKKYQKYYNATVTPATKLKIITFIFTPVQDAVSH